MTRGIYQHKSSWNKGKKLSKEHRKALIDAKIGKPSNAWKGDRVGYHGLHKWVQSRLGRPNACVFCGVGTKRRYEWANMSKEYKRELNDWIRLCVSCHRKYDETWKKLSRNKKGQFIRILITNL